MTDPITSELAENVMAHSAERLVMPLAIGIETQWGQVVAVGWTGNERYYWCVDRHGCTAMTPAIMVEEHNAKVSSGDERRI
jgi:hypothetical protein